jgi:hypothetical protein
MKTTAKKDKASCVLPFRAGFFLVEISITLIIAGTVLVVFMSAFSTSLKGIKRIRQLDAASQLSRSKMIELTGTLRKSGDVNPQNGTAAYDGRSYGWEAEFIPVEGTENSLYLINLKITEEARVIAEFATIAKK